MNEVEFRNWLINKGVKTKVAGDTISMIQSGAPLHPLSSSLFGSQITDISGST